MCFIVSSSLTGVVALPSPSKLLNAKTGKISRSIKKGNSFCPPAKFYLQAVIRKCGGRKVTSARIKIIKSGGGVLINKNPKSKKVLLNKNAIPNGKYTAVIIPYTTKGGKTRVGKKASFSFTKKCSKYCPSKGGTCGDGKRGNGICSNGACCSKVS